jgi:FkbM family methyltransferase
VLDRNLLAANDGFNRCVLGREGYLVYNKNDQYGGGSIERYGEAAELEDRLLRQLCRPNAVMIDVGANIGTHTLTFARAVRPGGFVIAYEPQRIVFQALCANLAVNSIANVDARCAAVGAAAGWAQIPDLDPNQPNNFGGVAVDPAGSRRVPLVRLDDDLPFLDRLRLIKIDVEGMELDVLRGAEGLIRRFMPFLYVENDRPELSETLIRHIWKLDYRLYWHTPALFNPENFFGDPVDIFGGIGSVNMLCVPRTGPPVQGVSEITDSADHPLKR